MKRALVVIGLVLTVGLWIGCSKDKDEVAQLEQEVKDAESQDLLADSGGAEEMAATAEDVAAETEYAAMAEEETEKSYEPSGTGGFTIQIGAGTSRADANYMAEKYIGRGYEAFITEMYADDITYYRIRIGNFATREEARAMAADLVDKYSVDYWIDLNY